MLQIIFPLYNLTLENSLVRVKNGINSVRTIKNLSRKDAHLALINFLFIYLTPMIIYRYKYHFIYHFQKGLLLVEEPPPLTIPSNESEWKEPELLLKDV